MSIGYYFVRVLKKLRGCAVKDSRIDRTSKVESGTQVVGCKIDKHSYLGYDCVAINCDVGSFVSIADRVVMGSPDHPMNWVSTSPVFQKGRNSTPVKFAEFDTEQPARISVDSDVWIGSDAIIKNGVHIGVGAVVGMGSVLTKDVEPYTIVAGNPARVIRRRFDDGLCEKLLASRWWLLPEDELRRCAQYIREPEKFLAALADKNGEV